MGIAYRTNHAERTTHVVALRDASPAKAAYLKSP